ncbi:MAG: sugar ABC transporter permease [Rubellimicrobium sp.]|nr:sugar ABC transporter permease [Rubellimicrobium sp.]
MTVAPGKRRRSSRYETTAAWLFVAPWVVKLVLLTVLPLIATVALGFMTMPVTGMPRWAGLANYEQMMADPAFRRSAQNSLTFALASVPLRLLIALGLALLLHRTRAFSGFYQTIFYLPFLMPAVAASIVFILLLTPGAGPVNVILQTFGLNPPDWLRDPRAALWTLVLISLWPLGVETLVFLSGLQNIPKDVQEAAELDSDRPWHRLVWITIPLITPMILFNLVIGIISSFQIFTQALVIGGPSGQPAESTLMYMVVIYRTAFRYFNLGYAAALSTVLFLGVLVVTLLIFSTARSWVHYEGGDQR